MNSKIVIRSEKDTDITAITELTVAAFKTLEIKSHRAVYYRGTTCLRGAHVIARGRGGWPCSRAYRFFASDHFGPYPEMVWTWTCFGVAEVPAAGHW